MLRVPLYQPKTSLLIKELLKKESKLYNKEPYIESNFLCMLYVWQLVCLLRSLFQYDTLTFNAWMASCCLCRQKADVSWTPLCIFSMDVIECKGRWQAFRSKWNYLTSPAVVMRPVKRLCISAPLKCSIHRWKLGIGISRKILFISTIFWTSIHWLLNSGQAASCWVLRSQIIVHKCCWLLKC